MMLPLEENDLEEIVSRVAIRRSDIVNVPLEWLVLDLVGCGHRFGFGIYDGHNASAMVNLESSHLFISKADRLLVEPVISYDSRSTR